MNKGIGDRRVRPFLLCFSSPVLSDRESTTASENSPGAGGGSVVVVMVVRAQGGLQMRRRRVRRVPRVVGQEGGRRRGVRGAAALR